MATLRERKENDPHPLHWRDRLAMRILMWIAQALITDDISEDQREELRRLKTAINVKGGGWLS